MLLLLHLRIQLLLTNNIFLKSYQKSSVNILYLLLSHCLGERQAITDLRIAGIILIIFSRNPPCSNFFKVLSKTEYLATLAMSGDLSHPRVIIGAVKQR